MGSLHSVVHYPIHYSVVVVVAAVDVDVDKAVVDVVDTDCWPLYCPSI